MTWKLISKSSYSLLLGELETKQENNQNIYRITVAEKHLNSGNFAHGGFLMSYADSVGGFHAYNKVKKPIVTVNLNCNFIKPVPINSWLLAKGKVKMCGKSLIFIEIEMFIKKNLVFSANGVWKIVNIVKN